MSKALVCSGCGKDLPVRFVQSVVDEGRKYCSKKCVRLYYNREKANGNDGESKRTD